MGLIFQYFGYFLGYSPFCVSELFPCFLHCLSLKVYKFKDLAIHTIRDAGYKLFDLRSQAFCFCLPDLFYPDPTLYGVCLFWVCHLNRHMLFNVRPLKPRCGHFSFYRREFPPPVLKDALWCPPGSPVPVSEPCTVLIFLCPSGSPPSGGLRPHFLRCRAVCTITVT